MTLNRRSFLKMGLATAIAPFVLPAAAHAARPAPRTFGRTKLTVSELGMGVMITPNPEVVRAALEAE